LPSDHPHPKFTPQVSPVGKGLRRAEQRKVVLLAHCRFTNAASHVASAPSLARRHRPKRSSQNPFSDCQYPSSAQQGIGRGAPSRSLAPRRDLIDLIYAEPPAADVLIIA
jgi:hypothetical protein